MIRITITKIEEVSFVKKEQICIKETPTDKVKAKDYGSGSEVVMAREYQVVDIPQTRTASVELLSQNISDDALDLAAVIKAINSL